MSRLYTFIPLVLIFFMISSYAESIPTEDASNCSLRLISKTNPITGKVTFAGKRKFAFSNENGTESLELLVVRQNLELTLRFKGDGEICLPKAQEINVITLDKQAILLKSNSPQNCEGTMIFNFGGIFGKETARDMLYQKGIESISFEDKDENGYFFTIKPTEKEELQLVMKCLMKM